MWNQPRRSRFVRPAVISALLLGSGCGDDGATQARMSASRIPKFEQRVSLPSVMPASRIGDGMTEYEIAVGQFRQQILPPPMPPTTVWGYGRAGDPSTFSYPGPTVETRSNAPVRVTWVNGLVDETGRYLPHLAPVDTSIHWANPGGGGATGHDHDHETTVGARYVGPVPIVTHVHGAHSFDHSDGYPDAWYLPDATNIPDGFARRGPLYKTQAEVGEGAAVFDYPQDENAATLWYHDHVIGMTRVNIYAGLAGFWLIRDEEEDRLDLPGPAPRAGDPPGTRYYELPLVIQDKAFLADGALFYPTSRTQYDGYPGPFRPDSEVPPIWGPEFFGDVIVVNGQTWPFLEVEPRLYRLRLLNASDARTLILQFDREGVVFTQIGSDGGFMAEVVAQRQLVLGPAERADVLIDFSTLAPGETFTLQNLGPDEPWGGPDAGQDPADPDTTGQVMQVRIVPATGEGRAGAVPAELPAIAALEPTVPPRDLLLSEAAVTVDGTDYPYHVQLGTVALGPLPWVAPTTEVIKLGSTEMWRVANTTEDAHPIHIHLIDFQVIDRLPFDTDRFTEAEAAWLAGTGPEPVLDDFVTGPALPPAPNERGPKDTVMMWPQTITRIIGHYDRAGLYVWHCHIIEHEDNDMMRPLEIVP